MLLESWGCKDVIAVSDQTQACASISEGFVPDLLISDFRLRENRSGLELINEVSNILGYKVRAILVTGDTAPESLLKIREAGLFVLHKPIVSQQLKLAIEDALL
jgi:CheY-like chemotaxis protein